mmetsp:Transcript_11582/g.44987  ORF Transcript_11582/g.44987 Transcript_11582/m.44987 type:complete len:332 (-) Transcript_11582:2015-3010(-)
MTPRPKLARRLPQQGATPRPHRRRRGRTAGPGLARHRASPPSQPSPPRSALRLGPPTAGTAWPLAARARPPLGSRTLAAVPSWVRRSWALRNPTAPAAFRAGQRLPASRWLIRQAPQSLRSSPRCRFRSRLLAQPPLAPQSAPPSQAEPTRLLLKPRKPRPSGAPPGRQRAPSRRRATWGSAEGPGGRRCSLPRRAPRSASSTAPCCRPELRGSLPAPRQGSLPRGKATAVRVHARYRRSPARCLTPCPRPEAARLRGTTAKLKEAAATPRLPPAPPARPARPASRPLARAAGCPRPAPARARRVARIPSRPTPRASTPAALSRTSSTPRR